MLGFATARSHDGGLERFEDGSWREEIVNPMDDVTDAEQMHHQWIREPYLDVTAVEEYY